jgi:hypothetical protein
MTIEEIARSKAPTNDTDIWIAGFKAGYIERKPKEVTICPHCGSTSLKWAYRFVKKCKSCNEVFPCESL